MELWSCVDSSMIPTVATIINALPIFNKTDILTVEQVYRSSHEYVAFKGKRMLALSFDR